MHRCTWQLSGQGSSPLWGVGAALVTEETSPAGGGWGSRSVRPWERAELLERLNSLWNAILSHQQGSCPAACQQKQPVLPSASPPSGKRPQNQPGAGVNWERGRPLMVWIRWAFLPGMPGSVGLQQGAGQQWPAQAAPSSPAAIRAHWPSRQEEAAVFWQWCGEKEREKSVGE